MDPMAVGGQGWAYVNSRFPGSCGGGPARGTSACDNPATITTPNCTSCGFPGHESDPNCAKRGDTCSDPNNPSGQIPQPGYYTAAEDVLNTRTIRMKQRYGVDPQYPIRRYTDGLGGTESAAPVLKVPNTAAEHDAKGVYALDAKNCRNPLFAVNLPTDPNADLCNLQPGPRGRDLVFFGTVTGVPWQLLTENPQDPGAAFKKNLTPDDWKKIVGNDPNKYDLTGIDPHMYESVNPNEGPRASLAPPSSGDTTDPFNGREWDSAQVDLQYACTFPLPQEKDCADPKLASACDCGPGKTAPLCKPGDPTKARVQIRGKAYPGIRQLTVARDLGAQGIAASICARTLDTANPDYGYRPAVNALLDRASSGLRDACLPAVPAASCIVVETLAQQGPESDCLKFPGLGVPSPEALTQMRALGGAKDYPICTVQKLTGADLVNGSCEASAGAGYCIAQGKGAGQCAQRLLFSPTGNPQVGASVNVFCP